MKKQSNIYIIAYATILVVIVAIVLSFAAIQLQDRQKINVQIEKKGAILATIGQGQNPVELSKDKAGYIKKEYDQYITENFLLDSVGQKMEGDAFAALDNLPEALNRGGFPIFVATVDGKTQYIIPVTGKGLWGPVWGYLALKDDCNTILGASFDHKGETPGLGAEIALKPFQQQFIGKTLFDENGKFMSIDLTKGVGSSAGNPHAVDAISGGTLTSNGVRAMLHTCLQRYVPFFKKAQTPTQITEGGIE